LQNEEVHQIVFRGGFWHKCKHFVPFVYGLLDFSILKRDLVESRGVRHGFVLPAHGEKAVNHHKDLPASNVAFMNLALLCLGLFDVLSQEMRIAWNSFHEGREEERV
jgi:hypothetical protein